MLSFVPFGAEEQLMNWLPAEAKQTESTAQQST